MSLWSVHLTDNVAEFLLDETYSLVIISTPSWLSKVGAIHVSPLRYIETGCLVLSGTPSPSVTTSIASTTSSSATSSTTSTSATAVPAQVGSSKKSNAGAIAGGTIAGLVVLAVVGLYILWKVMQKRRNAVQKDLSFDSSALVAPSHMYQQYTGSTSMNQPIMSHSRSPSGPSPTPTPYGNPSIYVSVLVIFVICSLQITDLQLSISSCLVHRMLIPVNRVIVHTHYRLSHRLVCIPPLDPADALWRVFLQV